MDHVADHDESQARVTWQVHSRLKSLGRYSTAHSLLPSRRCRLRSKSGSFRVRQPGDLDSNRPSEQKQRQIASDQVLPHQPRQDLSSGSLRWYFAIRYRNVLRVTLSRRLASDTFPPVLSSASFNMAFSNSSTDSPNDRRETGEDGDAADVDGSDNVRSADGRCSGLMSPSRQRIVIHSTTL